MAKSSTCVERRSHQARLKPKPGDCCVFCSYRSVPCPPFRAARRQA
ncbi:MAG: GDCCVxC domain-containing (seleno)protein [Burkholderiales bacterium]